MYYILRNSKNSVRVFDDFKRAKAQYRLWELEGMKIKVTKSEQVPVELLLARPEKPKQEIVKVIPQTPKAKASAAKPKAKPTAAETVAPKAVKAKPTAETVKAKPTATKAKAKAKATSR